MKPAVLLLLASTSVFAQTAAPKPQTTAAKPHTAATTRKPAVSPDSPPGVPKVVGIAKPLYSLRYIDTVVGKGELAAPRKWYTVNYTGYLASTGAKFDSSLDRHAPITFPYGARRVIPGWDTGFEGMHIGGKRRLFIPYQLAYGEAGNQAIPAKSNLIFDIELLAMSDNPPTPPTPPAPPKPATPAPDTATPPAGTPPPASSAPAPSAAPATGTPPPNK